MLSEIRIGPLQGGDGTVNPIRGAKDGSLIVASGRGDYEEATLRGTVFQAANQGPGGTTTTVALATTYTGLVISNPAGSSVNLVMLQCGVGVVGAPAALSTIGLLAGFAAAGVVTHTTPLVPLSGFLNTTVATGQGKADAAATLAGTPILWMPLGVTPITGATAQPINPTVVLNVYDFKGSLVLPPGAYVAIYTSTVLSIIGGFTWREVPITQS